MMMGTIQCTRAMDVAAKRNSDSGTRTAPAMPERRRASGGALPPWAAASRAYSLMTEEVGGSDAVFCKAALGCRRTLPRAAGGSRRQRFQHRGQGRPGQSTAG
jgi:hypothetical protein